MQIIVKAKVRKLGAIGVFYDRDFIVESAEKKPDRHKLFDLWSQQHGSEWELSHVIDFKTAGDNP